MLVPDARLECDLRAMLGCRNGDRGHLAWKRGNRAALVGRGAIVPVAGDALPPQLDSGPGTGGMRYQPVVYGPVEGSLHDGRGDPVEANRDYLRNVAETGRGGGSQSVLGHEAAGRRGR